LPIVFRAFPHPIETRRHSPRTRRGMTRSVLPVVLAICCFAAPADRAAAQSLRGSSGSVELMYRQAVSHDLHFYQTSSGIRRAADRGDFVRLGGNVDYALGSVSHPYVLPITRTFVHRLAAQYRLQCGERLVITSGARPQSMRLANSAARSVHPTGMAVDIRKPRNARCLRWLRETLAYLDGQGVVEAIEESRPPHFHVAVFPTSYRRYIQAGVATTRIASAVTAPAASGPSAPDATQGSAGRTYRVRRGDSLWSIARRSQTTVDELKNANALRSSRIVAGQVLVLPESTANR
jgi:hypothetical protein